MKKIILMSVGLSALLLSSPVLAKSNHVSLKVNPITGNQTSVNGKTAKLATIKVLHNKALLGKGIASKRGTFKITLKAPIKNGWKYTIQATKKGFAAKKYTVTALYASTRIDQPHYQDEIHDLQNMIVSLQSQLNDLKNKQSTTTVVNSDNAQTANTWLAYQKQIDALNDQISSINNQLEDQLHADNGGPLLTAQMDVSFYNRTNLSDLNNSLTKDQNAVINDNELLKQNPNDYTALINLQTDEREVSEDQKNINTFSEISSEGVDTYLKNAITEQSEFDKLNSESKSLDEQIDELQRKQAAVLNYLS
ncbi:Ig-like domain-containing protein [Levilactobacillus brevis]|uniref:Ig-like domain-containing protein n=1 Tax=Levilactobacillus brevis TaxID=1580 RepID=UPI0032E36CBB